MVLLACIALCREAQAIPSYSRKYDTSCQTCHVHYPVLNPFGEAFRRNGYRFPSQAGSLDSDATKEGSVALGQPESTEPFPHSVPPSRIAQAVSLSAVVAGTLPYALPRSDLRKNGGNTFNWDGATGPVMLFASGAFTDKITYFANVIALPSGVTLGPVYLLVNDIIGPRHLVNLWAGRLVAPQLTSFMSSGTYLVDKTFPAVSVAGLFNTNHSFILGQGPVNGVELNGVAVHRFAYSLGWLSSFAQTGINSPNAEDFYARVGTKVGGATLDGEGGNAARAVDLARPWAETSLALDVFGYRGVSIADNYTNQPAVTPQRSPIEAIGASLRGQFRSLTANLVVQRQSHFRPYAGSSPLPANPPAQADPLPGIPDNSQAKGVVGLAELSYVVFPWFVPAVRAERTWLSSNWGKAKFTRLMPGASLLLLPNVKLSFYADVQYAHRRPPQLIGVDSNWSAAGGTLNTNTRKGDKSAVEAIVMRFSWGF